MWGVVKWEILLIERTCKSLVFSTIVGVKSNNIPWKIVFYKSFEANKDVMHIRFSSRENHMYFVKWSTKITWYLKSSWDKIGDVQISEKIISSGWDELRYELAKRDLWLLLQWQLLQVKVDDTGVDKFKWYWETICLKMWKEWWLKSMIPLGLSGLDTR